jgi:hypothetical protein
MAAARQGLPVRLDRAAHSRHIVGMRDGIDQVRSNLFTVDQLAAHSNFGSGGRQLFCARLRLTELRRLVSVLYQIVDTATWLGLLGMALRREPSRSGSARLGRFQKDGLPSRSCGN